MSEPGCTSKSCPAVGVFLLHLCVPCSSFHDAAPRRCVCRKLHAAVSVSGVALGVCSTKAFNPAQIHFQHYHRRISKTSRVHGLEDSKLTRAASSINQENSSFVPSMRCKFSGPRTEVSLLFSRREGPAVLKEKSIRRSRFVWLCEP